MGDPLNDRDTMQSGLSAAVDAARAYMERLDGLPARSPTVYRGQVAFRPAISNWRTTAKEVDEILPIARELARRSN